jgi:chromosomal replication initiation ATPase DnaA
MEAVERTLQTAEFAFNQAVKLSSVSCGAKACRLEITHDNPNALERFQAMLPTQLAWGYAVEIAHPADNLAVLFLQREAPQSVSLGRQ